MSSTEDSCTSDTSSDESVTLNLVKAAILLRRLKSLLARQSPVVNHPSPASAAVSGERGIRGSSLAGVRPQIRRAPTRADSPDRRAQSRPPSSAAPTSAVAASGKRGLRQAHLCRTQLRRARSPSSAAPVSAPQSTGRFIGCCSTLPTLDASSSSSCSPPVARQYNLRSKCHTIKDSIDDCLRDLSDIIKDSKKRKAREDSTAEEVAQIVQILKQDGYSETDPVFLQALNLCHNKLRRRAFLDLETKEARLNWVKITWDSVVSKSD